MSDAQLRKLERLCVADPTAENKQRLYDARKRAGLIKRETHLFRQTSLGRITTSEEWQVVESFSLSYGMHIIYMHGFVSGCGAIGFRAREGAALIDVGGIFTVDAENVGISTNSYIASLDATAIDLVFKAMHGQRLLLDSVQVTLVSNP